MTSYLSDPKRSCAVLIGVYGQEKPSDLDPIEAVERNLTGLADALMDPEIWGLPHGHVTTVRQPTTAEEIFNPVIEAGSLATDTLLVYYAGHGLPDTYDEKELYLALPTSRKFRFDTASRYELLRRYLSSDQVKADKVIIILDCCFSGRALLGPMSATEGLADLAAVPGRCVLTASAATKIAMAPPGETYTAFTGVLLELLTDGVPDGPELLDMQTLFEEALAELQAQSRPLPQLGSQGSPGQICIAKNRAVQTTPISHPDPQRGPPMPTVPPRRPKRVEPHRLAALVRERLLEPPQFKGLEFAPRADMKNGMPEIRARHYLEQGEELIAWGAGIVFTSRGIRMFRRKSFFSFQPDRRWYIRYNEFDKYEFTYTTGSYWQVYTHSGAGRSVTTHHLSIRGPNSWEGAAESRDLKYLADDLNYIKKIASG